MDIRTQTTLLASIVATALGLSLVLRSGRARVLTAYAVFAFGAGAFYLSDFLRSVFLSGGLTGWPDPGAADAPAGGDLLRGAGADGGGHAAGDLGGGQGGGGGVELRDHAAVAVAPGAAGAAG